MVIRIALITTLLFCITSSWSNGQNAGERVERYSNITVKISELNESHSSLLTTEWRKGHVTPRKIDSKALKKTANGFQIQLPSKAPIPTPTVYKEKLYVSGGFHSKEFYCFNAETGEFIWGVNLDDDGPSSAVVEQDVVVFNTESCTIFALDANTGKMLWSWWLGDPLMSTPTIYNGCVYTSYPKRAPNGSATHVMACFELKTGNVLWQKWIDSDVMSAPVGVDSMIYATTFSGTLYKFDATTGEIPFVIKNQSTSAPIIINGELFFTKRTDRDGKIRESISRAQTIAMDSVIVSEGKEAIYLDKDVQDESEYKALGKSLDAGNGFGNGAPLAANAMVAYENIGQSNVSTLQAFQGSRLLHHEGKNFNTMGDEIFCTNPDNSETIWSKKISGSLEHFGGAIGTSPIIAGEEIIITTYQGKVLRISPNTGRTIATYATEQPIRSQPAVMNGRIYVGTQSGMVICIDTQETSLTGWSTWGGNSAHTGTAQRL